MTMASRHEARALGEGFCNRLRADDLPRGGIGNHDGRAAVRVDPFAANVAALAKQPPLEYFYAPSLGIL
jgi:hypothetical protein